MRRHVSWHHCVSALPADWHFDHIMIGAARVGSFLFRDSATDTTAYSWAGVVLLAAQVLVRVNILIRGGLMLILVIITVPVTFTHFLT